MRHFRLLLSCIGLVVVSCEGNNKYGDYPPYPVSGQILVNGKPAHRAVVFFYLDGYTGERTILPQGMTDAEGRFNLSTYSSQDGAPAGDYHVVVVWPPEGAGMRSGQDRLGGKFKKVTPESPTAHIEKNKNELKPIDIQAEVKDLEPERKIKKKRDGN